MTTSPAIVKRYRAAFQPGTPYHILRRATRTQPATAHHMQVPDWVSNLIEFRVVKESGEGCLRIEQVASSTSDGM